MADEKFSQTISLIIQAIDETKGALGKATADLRTLNEASSVVSKGLGKTSDALKACENAYAAVQADVKKTAAVTKEMAGAAQVAAQAVDKESKSLDAAGASAEKSVGKFAKAKDGIRAIGDAAQGAIGAITGLIGTFATMGMPVIEAAQFERKIKEVGSISEATSTQLKDMADVARQMGKDTEYSALQAASGMKELAAGGLNAQEAMAALPDTLNLAMSDSMELAAAAEYAMGIMNGMQMQVKDLGHITDVLAQTSADSASSVSSLAEALSYAAPEAAAIKMPLEQTAAALGILHNNGIKASSAGTNFRGVITALVDPTEEAKRALAGMGVEIAKTADGSIDFFETLKRLHNANMTLAQSTQIFNKLNAGAALIFSNSLDKLTESTNNNIDSQGRAAKMAADFNATTVGTWRNFTSAMSDAAIEIGDKFRPAIESVLKTLTSFANGVANLAKEFPVTTKTLGFLLVGLTTFIALAGMAKVAAFTMGGGLEMMATGFTFVIGAVTRASVAIRGFSVANPILAALTGVVVVATAAWKVFGKTSLDSSKQHADMAEKINATREAAEKEVKSLKDLKESLLNTKQGSKEHADAEEKLARIVPGVNTELDNQGRILGTVKGQLDGNIQKLNEYIALKEKESQIQAALQLEQLARAYFDAGTAVEGYKNNLQKWYGVGQSSTSMLQNFWRGLNQLTGTYDKNIQSGSQMIENLDQQKTKFEEFLQKLANSGATIDQVSAMLNNIHLDEGTKNKIITQYGDMLKGMEAKAKESAEAVKDANNKSATKTATYSDEQLKEMASQWEQYAQKVKSITQEISGMQRGLNAELRDMSRSTMDDSKAWQDRKKEADGYYKASQDAIAAAKAAKNAGNNALAEQKMEEAKDNAIAAKDAYKDLNKEVKVNGEIIIPAAEAQKTAMDGVFKAGTQAIEVTKLQRQEALNGMAEIEKKIGFKAIKGQIGEVKAEWGQSWETMAQSADEKLQKIRTTMNGLIEQAQKWATVWQFADGSSKVVKGEGSTVTGVSESPKKYAVGGYTRRAGSLPGWGGGDRIRALLEAGEFIIRKEAVRKYGLGLFHALNSMTAGAGSIVKAKVGGLIPAISMSNPVKLQTGGSPGQAAVSKVVELRFGGGSLFGDAGSVDALLKNLETAGLAI